MSGYSTSRELDVSGFTKKWTVMTEILCARVPHAYQRLLFSHTALARALLLPTRSDHYLGLWSSEGLEVIYYDATRPTPFQQVVCAASPFAVGDRGRSNSNDFLIEILHRLYRNILSPQP